LRNIS